MSKNVRYLIFMSCLLFFFACFAKSKDGIGRILVSPEKPIDLDPKETISLSVTFDPESNFGERLIQLELYENVINEAVPQTVSPVGYYRESFGSQKLFVRTPAKEYFGKMLIEGRRYLIPFYSKSFRKTVLFGLKYVPESKSFTQSRIVGHCLDSEEFVMCPKLFSDRKQLDLLVHKNFHWNSIDGEMTLRQWLVIALLFGITKYPIPLVGTVDFSENLQVTKIESTQ